MTGFAAASIGDLALMSSSTLYGGVVLGFNLSGTTTRIPKKEEMQRGIRLKVNGNVWSLLSRVSVAQREYIPQPPTGRPAQGMRALLTAVE